MEMKGRAVQYGGIKPHDVLAGLHFGLVTMRLDMVGLEVAVNDRVSVLQLMNVCRRQRRGERPERQRHENRRHTRDVSEHGGHYGTAADFASVRRDRKNEDERERPMAGVVNEPQTIRKHVSFLRNSRGQVVERCFELNTP